MDITPVFNAISGMLSEILIASGGVAVITKGIKSFIAKRKIKKFTNGLLDVGHLYDILQEIRAELNCDRILITKTTNGGGIPKVSTSVYATILHEVYDSIKDSIKNEWQQRPVDSFYWQFLCNLVKAKKVILSVSEIDGELRKSYERHGHKKSYVIAIKSTEEMFIYMSFVFSRDEISAAEEDKINATVSRVRNLFDNCLGGPNVFK
jgi:hypothetical protein